MRLCSLAHFGRFRWRRDRISPRLSQNCAALWFQLAASFRATALFPILLLLLHFACAVAKSLPSLLMLLGTQCLHPVQCHRRCHGCSHGPERGRAYFGFTTWDRWRYLTLPAIFPYLIGMITVCRRAWNASIIAEYSTFRAALFPPRPRQHHQQGPAIRAASMCCSPPR